MAPPPEVLEEAKSKEELELIKLIKKAKSKKEHNVKENMIENKAKLLPPPKVLEEKDLMNKHMLNVMKEQKLAKPEKAKLLDMVEKVKKQKLAMMEKAKNKVDPPPLPEVLEEKDLMNKDMLDVMRERKLARLENAKLLDVVEKANSKK